MNQAHCSCVNSGTTEICIFSNTTLSANVRVCISCLCHCGVAMFMYAWMCMASNCSIFFEIQKFIPFNFQIKQILHLYPVFCKSARASQYCICFSSYQHYCKPNLLFFCTFSFLCSGVARAWGQAHFGKGSGRVWLDEVRCTGNELTLEQCPKSAWGEHNCLHSEDAGVSCSPLTGRTTPDSAWARHTVIYTKTCT